MPVQVCGRSESQESIAAMPVQVCGRSESQESIAAMPVRMCGRSESQEPVSDNMNAFTGVGMPNCLLHGVLEFIENDTN